MMILLYILIGLALLILILAVTAPKTYSVSRDITIERPPDEIFTYLKYLKNQDEWSPWQRRDPKMHKEYVGTDGEVGFISKWEGNKEVGKGEQEITGITEGKRVDSQFRFLKPFKSTSDAWMEVRPKNPGISQVEWGFKGKNTFPFSVMSHFMSMDKMIGKDFEEGLQHLKEKLEK